MKLLISLIILTLAISCKHDEQEASKFKQASSAVASKNDSFKEKNEDEERAFIKAPFNYFAPEKGSKPGVYWFSLGRDSNGGYTCSPACQVEEFGAFTYDDIKDVVIVTDKGIYRQTVKREDIKKECKEPFDEGDVYCINKAFFSLNSKDKPVIVLADATNVKNISFKPFETHDGTKDEIKKLIEKDEGKMIACGKTPIDSDSWRYECYKWERNEKGELVLMIGRAPLKSHYSKTYIAWKFKPIFQSSIRLSACNRLSHYESFKIIYCTEYLNIVIKEDTPLHMRLGEASRYSPDLRFVGELVLDGVGYLIEEDSFAYAKFNESRYLNLFMIDKMEYIPVHRRKSEFLYPLIY